MEQISKLEFVDHATRKGLGGTPRVVMHFKVVDGPLKGMDTYCWRNVDKLKGNARDRGGFFAKDANNFGPNAKYNTEWLKFAPSSKRRDRMSPVVFKDKAIYGTLYKTKDGEVRVEDLYHPDDVKAMSAECPMDAKLMPDECPGNDKHPHTDDAHTLLQNNPERPPFNAGRSVPRDAHNLPAISVAKPTNKPKDQSAKRPSDQINNINLIPNPKDTIKDIKGSKSKHNERPPPNVGSELWSSLDQEEPEWLREYSKKLDEKWANEDG